MNKQKWQHEHFLNAFFTNSQRPVVDCLNVAAGILTRSKLSKEQARIGDL